MKILSLFDGMSCGMIAFIMAGVNIERYVAFENDKYAIKASKTNFPIIEHMGDVFDANFSELNDFDFLIGGSPCTYWSIAQTKGRETEASGLGWELFSKYVEALHSVKPKYFIYENNRSMSDDIRNSIRSTFGFDEVCIDSALLSAQMRKRYYWVGKLNNNGTYSKVNVPQPKDLGILLKDILETGSKAFHNKSYCITATEGKGDTVWHAFKNHVRTKCAEPVRVGCMPSPDGLIHNAQGFRIYSDSGKSVTLRSNAGGAGGKTGIYALPIDVNISSNTLFDIDMPDTRYATACEWDNFGVPTKAISFSNGKVYDVYLVKNNIVIIKGNPYPIKLRNGYYIFRSLSIAECRRLQTIPDWYTFDDISNIQTYKLLGNGWTCSVITHIINCCLQGR